MNDLHFSLALAEMGMLSNPGVLSLTVKAQTK